MVCRSSPLLVASAVLAGFVTSLGSCGGDTVARSVVDAARPDRGVPTKPGEGGSSGGSSKDPVGGMSSLSAGGAVGGSQTSGGQGGSGGMGGAAASSSANGGRTRADAGSPDRASTGGPLVDASVVADVSRGEVGPLACNDKTSNGRLGVYYYTGSSAAETQDVQIHLALINFTALTARLSQATVRYWFTDEDMAAANMLTMYYTPTTLAKITTRFLPATPPRVGADTVLEFSFTPLPDAGPSFIETTEFNFAFHKDGYASTYNQANDYSFDPSLTQKFGPNPRITAYIGGELAWGCEPPVDMDAGVRD